MPPISNELECSKNFEFVWKRPEAPPRVWSVIEGRKRLEDGTFPNFIIQEMPEEMMEEVLDHMIYHCFTEEPISDYCGFANDPLGMQEMRSYVKCWLLQGISIVTLLVNSDPTIKPLLVGANVLGVTTAQDDVAMKDCVEQFESQAMKSTLPIEYELTKEVDVLEIFGIDKYLGSFGLSVLPAFRGNGLGEKMLRLREKIGSTYGVSVSVTYFTGPTSQVLAERTGFKVLIERKYAEILDRQGKVAFPGIRVECIKVMAKILY